MAVRVGINGFGRIGRNFYRAARKSGADIDLVAVNDLTSPEINAHLLKYDTTHGKLEEEVKVTGDGITVGSDSFKVFAERDPAALPWKDLGVDVVIESTGIFTDRDKAAAHIEAGARAPGLVLQSMQGKLDGTALRVPVSDGSITDFVGVLKRDVTVDEVNDAYRAAAGSGPLAKVLEYSEDPIVSSDIVGSSASC